jgi:hypothetical protein
VKGGSERMIVMTGREDVRKMMVKENIDDLKKVTEYLKAHPLANVMEVYAKTGVSMSRILDFVRMGVLKIRDRKAS